MYRVDEPTAVSVKPDPKPATGNGGYFTDGNPATGMQATIVPADWLNMVQEASCCVIEAAGLELSKTDPERFLQALQELFITPPKLASAIEGMAFASGTQMLFIQSAAPTGWTKVTDHNDKALRIVSGAGGGAGGSVAFSAAFASRAISGSVGNTTLTEWQMPIHSHHLQGGWTGGANNAGGVFGSSDVGTKVADWTSAAGGNGAHNHSLTINPLNMAVQYVDAIICRKD